MDRLRWICIGVLILCSYTVKSQLSPECEAIGITQPLGFTTQVVPATVLPGDDFCIEFYAQDFESVLAFQFTFGFDPTQMCFNSFFEDGIFEDPLNANITQVQAGILNFLWIDNSLESKTFPDNSLLFTVCFNACGESSECYELGYNDQLPNFPNSEVTYQPSLSESCTSDVILIDGANSTCIPIACTELTIIDLNVCSSDNNMGSFDFTLCGGTAPYAYEVITNGPSGPITVKVDTLFNAFEAPSGPLENLPPNVYTLIITDASGAMLSRPVIIDDIPATQYDPIIVVDPLCPEVTNGSIEINNINNLLGETFDVSFSNGVTFQDVNDVFLDRLVVGDYFVTITNGEGCETVEMITLFTPELEIDIVTTPASCPGSGDGFLSIDVTGGTPFPDGTYMINGEARTSIQTTTPFLDPEYSSFTNRYRIRITDANGCQYNEDIEIPVLSELEVEISGLQDVNCKNSCTGSMKLVVTDPPGNYTYLIRDEDNNFVSLPVLGDTLFADQILCAGRYSVLVRSFDTGCEKDTFFIINEPADELIVSFNEVMVSCSGNDGEIILDVTGGMTPYIFNWEDDPSNNTNTLSNVGNGSYNVSIEDDLGCIIDTFVNVISDNTLEIEGFIETNLACDGTGTGLLNVNILNSSSTVDPTYEWTDINGSPIGGTQTQSFNTPGDYIIIATTADNGCEARDTVNVPTEFGLTLEIILSNPACAEGQNGAIEITNIQGGEGPYTCIWENNTITSCNPQDLMVGTYNFSVIDVNGCQKDTFATLFATGANFDFDINTTNVTCPDGSDGSVDIINFSGGEAPYQCVWEDPIFSCNPTDLAAGIYNFAIIDNNNCSIDTFVEIFQPSQNITFDLDIDNPSCGGGLGAITINNLDGANAPFDVTWSDNTISGLNATDLIAGDYTITITDARLCEIDTTVTLISTSDDFQVTITATPPDCATGLDNGTISFPGFNGTCMWEDPALDVQNCTLIGLAPGIYNVTLTDDTGCQKDTFIDLQVDQALEAEITNIVDVDCFGGSDGQATVEITNDPLNVGTYNFLWSNPSDNGSGMVGNANQLSAGDNFVIVNDGTCSTDTINFEIGSPDLLMLDINNITIQNPVCKGDCNGAISLAAIGGTSVSGDYNYLWEDGDTNANRSDLCPGEYNITIIDDLGCEGEGLLLLMDPDTLIVNIDSLNIVNLDCNNDDIASIPVSASGGCGNFTYEWSNNVSNSSTASNLVAGIYSVTVTDACGCSQEVSYEILPTTNLEATLLDFEDPLCPGDLTCIGVESATGGTNMNFTYSINRGQRIPIDSCVMVGPGPYTINVFDSGGCSIEFSFDVANPDQIDVDLGEDLIFDIGQDAAQLNAVVTGGLPDYSFSWISEAEFTCVTNSCETIAFTPSNFTVFEVIVTDQNGCTAKDDIIVDIKATRNVYVPNVFNPSAQPPNDKFIPLTGFGVEEIEIFRIFDRWGNLVFEKENLSAPTNIDDGWDGRRGNGPNSNLVPGVYVYTAQIRFVDGVSLTYSGEVTLIR